MTGTTPELAPPLQTSALPQREDVWTPAYDLTCNRPNTRRIFRRIGSGTWTLRPQNRDLTTRSPRPPGGFSEENATYLYFAWKKTIKTSSGQPNHSEHLVTKSLSVYQFLNKDRYEHNQRTESITFFLDICSSAIPCLKSTRLLVVDSYFVITKKRI
ncbi:hypothetical protein AVEN_10492-1 [Araneus ventricosus]|uniref:Uncharacterized protein n=1 Tax=Araneus ventricosus TaxID=182803 RepID=A0A4Y2MVB1_ARAVE|nr:hypothetical protein AVEN_10492-1 [Araneus ventricosus]